MKTHYNYIIQGAGASGLWLAYWMQKSGLLTASTLLIVEGDAHKKNDRTWCFWEDESQQNLPFVSRSWRYLSVLGQKQAIAPYRYSHCRSQDFYQWVRNALADNENIHWVSAWAGLAVASNDGVSVTINDAAITANWFFRSGHFTGDTKNGTVNFWQSFVGWRVRFSAPYLPEDEATLMDFSIPQNNRTRFLYVLPMSDREALIEVTQFDREKLTQADGEKLLSNICAARGWDIEVTEFECNAIPMSAVLDNVQSHWPIESRIIDIGVAAGALKPTTGYGFLRMMNHGKQIVEALQVGASIPTIYRKSRFRFYDRLLLNILTDHPQRGKSVFERLFAKRKASVIMKFLNENTSVWQEIQIFRRLQVGLFLRVLLRHGGK